MNSHFTYAGVVDPKPKIFWLECYDPRFAVAFQKFRDEFGFDEHRGDILKRCAGGPMPLAHPKDLPSRFKQLSKQVRFAFEYFPSLEEIVAIMHADCGFYRMTPEKCHGRARKERADLSLTGGHLQGLLPGRKVTLYHAELIGNRTSVRIEEETNFQSLIIPDSSPVLQAIS